MGLCVGMILINLIVWLELVAGVEVIKYKFTITHDSTLNYLPYSSFFVFKFDPSI